MWKTDVTPFHTKMRQQHKQNHDIHISTLPLQTQTWYYPPFALLMCICPNMMKSLPYMCVSLCVCFYPVVWIPGRARAQASLLQFTSITSYNPISHSIDPQNCCSPEPAANTGILPIISPPLFFITQRSPPSLSQSKLSPAEIWIINVWLIKEKGGGREGRGVRERRGER